MILRGGSNGPNFETQHVAMAAKMLAEKKLSTKVMIDCSHGNSRKKHENQPTVCEYVVYCFIGLVL